MRATTEHRVANDYTYRQIRHIAETYIKDKFLVVSEIAKALSGKGKSGGGKPGGVDPDSRPKVAPKGSKDSRGLYSWYKLPYRVDARGRTMDTRHKVVDLDGPMEALSPYLGKGKIKKHKSKFPKREEEGRGMPMPRGKNRVVRPKPKRK